MVMVSPAVPPVIVHAAGGPGLAPVNTTPELMVITISDIPATYPVMVDTSVLTWVAELE
jgi:hypothetical protein